MELKFSSNMPEFVLKLLTEKGITAKIGGADNDRVLIDIPGKDIAEQHRMIKEATGLNQDTDYTAV